MGQYLLRRLLQSILVLLLVSGIVFLVLNLSGDPVRLLLPPDASSGDIAIFREAMGLDRPLMIRYLSYMKHAVVLDFGNSTQNMQPALGLVGERLPATLGLGFAAIFLATAVGIPLGVYSAVNKGGFVDYLGLSVGLLGQSVPAFWLAILMILTFSVKFGVLPPGGTGGLSHWIMPTATLAILLVSGLIRVVRASMLDILGKQYLRTAKAKGLRESVIIFKHALRNAAIPIVTQLGLQARVAVGGSVIIETIFGWPGLGRLMINGVLSRDYPVVEAGVFVFALCLIAVNLVVDILYSLLNPRVTLS